MLGAPRAGAEIIDQSFPASGLEPTARGHVRGCRRRSMTYLRHTPAMEDISQDEAETFQKIADAFATKG
jgi:hypothetical protein